MTDGLVDILKVTHTEMFLIIFLLSINLNFMHVLSIIIFQIKLRGDAAFFNVTLTIYVTPVLYKIGGQ